MAMYLAHRLQPQGKPMVTRSMVRNLGQRRMVHPFYRLCSIMGIQWARLRPKSTANYYLRTSHNPTLHLSQALVRIKRHCLGLSAPQLHRLSSQDPKACSALRPLGPKQDLWMRSPIWLVNSTEPVPRYHRHGQFSILAPSSIHTSLRRPKTTCRGLILTTTINLPTLWHIHNTVKTIVNIMELCHPTKVL